MKNFFDILICIVIVIGLLTIVLQSYTMAFVGIAVFFCGCLIEFIINRNKT